MDVQSRKFDLRQDNDSSRYISLAKFTCLQCSCCMILASQNGVQELNQGDWFCFDRHDMMNTVRCQDFDVIFVLEDSDNSGPQEYKHRNAVLAKQMENNFFVYNETMRFVGKRGDYIIQDTVRPFIQWICCGDEFNTIFLKEEQSLKSNISSDSIEVEMANDPVALRYSVWGPDIKGRPVPNDSNDLSSQAEISADLTTPGERVEIILDDSNSMLYRQHSASLFAFKLNQSCSLWKKHSGQGGRSHGQTGDMLVVHSTGDVEGFFSKEDFARHFRCNEVDVGVTVTDPRPSEATDIFSVWSGTGARRGLSRIYDVRASKMAEPFVAYTDTGERQYGNRGDYLLQTSLDKALVPSHLFLDDNLRPSSCVDRTSMSSLQPDAAVELTMSDIDLVDDDPKPAAHGQSGVTGGVRTPIDVASTIVTCQWVVTGKLFPLQYFPVAKVENAIRQRGESSVSDLSVVDNLDTFRDIHNHVPNIYAQPFDVYSPKVLCWEGILKKRSKLLRQWQGKQCELYPDKLVVGKDVDSHRKSSSGSDIIITSECPSSPKRASIMSGDPTSYICLKNCSVHQTMIDDKPVIYLGNARMNDDDSSQLPLEPYHVTSDYKRWESRYTKWFSVGSPSSSTSRPSLLQSKSSVEAGKGSAHLSFSNKSGIFIQANDVPTHNALVALLEGCILFCRREMAFVAALEGNCQRTLDVLCSVSPTDACKIVSATNDPKTGRLLQHEAARTSLELLHTIYQFFEFEQEEGYRLSEKNSLISRPSSMSDISSKYHIEPLVSTVRPNSRCILGLSCLHYAVEASKLDVIEFIVENSFLEMPINSVTLSGETPLHFAQTSKVVYYLLENGANPVALDFQGNSPMMLMAERGNFAALTALIRKVTQENININTQSWKTGSTALINAINRLSKSATDYSDVLILVELLLHYGADPEVSDIQKNTCLHSVCSIFRAACSDNSKDPARREVTQQVIVSCRKLMKILVEYGSNKKAINCKGHIPFTIVAQSKNYAVDTETVRSVLDSVIYGSRTVGADSNTSESNEDYLLDVKEILNFRTETGASGLHLAVEAVNPDILQYLLEKGVDANCKDSRGYTPLDVLKSKQSRAGGGMVERQAADLLKCLSILYDHGAVRRLRADLPVEQDSDSVIFSRLANGRYHVKSATLDAMVKRLCNDQLYCDEDARALVLAYKKVCTHAELLQKVVVEFQRQIDVVRQSRSFEDGRNSMDGCEESVVQSFPEDIIDLSSKASRQEFISADISQSIENRSRIVVSEDIPQTGYKLSDARSVSDVDDSNDLSQLLRNAFQDEEILRPGGVLSTVMMWFNMMECDFGVFQDDVGADFYHLARQLANMILRNCPEELSRESISLLNMGLSQRGLDQHIIRGLGCIYKSRVEKQRSYIAGSSEDVKRSIEAGELDDMIEAAALGDRYKKDFIDTLMGRADTSRLASIQPIEFAQQVTIMQHHLFSKIPQAELLSMKYRDDNLCPHIKVMRDWNNEVTNFLINEILYPSTIHGRAGFIAFLINSAFICLNIMNNFDFAVIVLGVLECTAVYRLKATWERVEKIIPGKREEFKQLVGIGGRNVNSLMNKCTPPLVPYLGCYLQKLINLNEIPTEVENGQHLNITKFRAMALILYSHQEAQKVNYKIDIDMTLQVLLISPVEWTTEDEFITRSRELEPPTERR